MSGQDRHPLSPHRSSGFVGFTNRYAAANYIFADSSTPSGICSFPLRACGSGDLYGGNEPARTWFEAMKRCHRFGDVHLPPTDPLYVEGAPAAGCQCVRAERGYGASAPQGGRFPGRRPADIGEQLSLPMARGGDLAERSNLPGIDHHDQHQQRDCAGTAATSGRAPPDFPGLPPEVGMTVVEIPGLPPITVPIFGPPPPAETATRLAVGRGTAWLSIAASRLSAIRRAAAVGGGIGADDMAPGAASRPVSSAIRSTRVSIWRDQCAFRLADTASR